MQDVGPARGWSKTQAVIALSSAEAELIAMVKCTAECIGITSMMKDYGRDAKIKLYADSSAALAIAKRKGAILMADDIVLQRAVQDREEQVQELTDRIEAMHKEYEDLVCTQSVSMCECEHVSVSM